MNDFSTRLGLPYLMPAQAQKHVTVNESLRALDALVQMSAVTRGLAGQPAAPADGECYILPAGKTGLDWGPMADGAVAYYRDGAWVQLRPKAGWRVWIADEAIMAVYDGEVWRETAGGNGLGPDLRSAFASLGFRLEVSQLADDTAAELDLGEELYGVIGLIRTNVREEAQGLFFFRNTATLAQASSVAMSGDVGCYDDVVLTGTHGADGQTNISTARSHPHSLFIENRTGVVRSYLIYVFL